ncbi:hypothetical protein ENUP19_0266G0027 [Entamoeba nuttalli]|uniref:Uncharacterized protein n=2 Tax=Entamoeba nuttalli TaxID=412467 RepID=K2GRM2_ENTNP|nr:hypothetical protein ENU1_192370 [Entamoeba nuttalli P19]EKE37588.1 hypothetical protein ENU1_192370 [Entamoeba nuttalli P19]|eukprot:XP_008860066.1 hypothetical protein ENU1_192370 [Entamoeba nuttalli P19]
MFEEDSVFSEGFDEVSYTSQLSDIEWDRICDDIVIPPRDSNPIKLVLSAPSHVFDECNETNQKIMDFNLHDDVFEITSNGFFLI